METMITVGAYTYHLVEAGNLLFLNPPEDGRLTTSRNYHLGSRGKSHSLYPQE